MPSLEGKRWRWAGLAASVVVIMLLLVFAQSNLTSYEERHTYKVQQAEAVLTTREAKLLRETEGPKEDYAQVVQDVLRIRGSSPSRRGKKYRSLICTLTRNDPHLREYVVRNLLAGFSHVVIYDNNQIGRGIDYDVRHMLKPFIEAGAVTLVPWDQNSTARHLDNERKNQNSVECNSRFGPQADWVSIMDTDEAFYVRDPEGRGLGGLDRLLDEVEKTAPETCALKFPWRMMYGEKRVLKPPGLLMDNYHKVCKIHDAPKLVYRPERTELYNIPHFCNCLNDGGRFFRTDDGDFKALFPRFENHLQHYYAKSVEEFIVKLEQSIPPYFRYLPEAYDHITHCFDGFDVTLDEEYEGAVRGLMERFERAAPKGENDGGRRLGPPPEFAVGKLENWELYMFFKARVALRDEWDEGRYLAMHGDVEQGISKGQWVDGLQHFMTEGFKAQRRSCWVREGVSKHCIGD